MFINKDIRGPIIYNDDSFSNPDNEGFDDQQITEKKLPKRNFVDFLQFDVKIREF